MKERWDMDDEEEEKEELEEIEDENKRGNRVRMSDKRT